MDIFQIYFDDLKFDLLYFFHHISEFKKLQDLEIDL